MAGTLRKKGSSYQFEYTYKGKRHYGSISCDEVKNEKEAREKLEEFCVEVRKGNYIEKTYTFFEFSSIWLKEIVKPNFSPTTLSAYIKHLNNRILPKLGNYKLTDITPLLINSFINELKDGKTMFATRENKPLAKGTIQKIYNIIRAILQKAYEYELINANPCKRVKLNLNNVESEKKDEIHYYDKDTYNRVLKLLENEDFGKRAVIEMALKTGLRRSEIWGLTWNDIDFENKEISVNKSRQKINGEMKVCACKTKSSIRKISIPQSLIILLEEYKIETPDSEFVFEGLDIDNVPAWFKNWQIKNKIERIKFHDLRHTHATLLLYAGVDIKTISERLGHSSIGMTMNVYTHVLKELDRKASDAIDNL